MTTKPKPRGLTQSESAQYCDVDRTTIRAWQEDGMPYDKPEKRGGQGSYQTSILAHWLFLVAAKKEPKVLRLMPANMSPAESIAWAHMTVSDPWGGDAIFAKQLHQILDSYYDRQDIDRAIGFAMAYNKRAAA